MSEREKLSEYERRSLLEIIARRSEHPAVALIQGFVWEKTEWGNRYWSTQHRTLEAGGWLGEVGAARLAAIILDGYPDEKEAP